MEIEIIDLKGIRDSRGLLVPIEGEKTIPFKIKRTYFLTKLNPNCARGFHAHKNLKQVAVCVKGSCTFTIDDGSERVSVLLDSPEKGILIRDLIWREMSNFSDDCIILVIASELYDEDDYIRSYEDFIRVKKNVKS